MIFIFSLANIISVKYHYCFCDQQIRITRHSCKGSLFLTLHVFMILLLDIADQLGYLTSKKCLKQSIHLNRYWFVYYYSFNIINWILDEAQDLSPSRIVSSTEFDFHYKKQFFIVFTLFFILKITVTQFIFLLSNYFILVLFLKSPIFKNKLIKSNFKYTY